MAYKYSSRRLISSRSESPDDYTSKYSRTASPSRLSLAERLRSTAEKYNSSSLPDRHNRHKNSLSVDGDPLTTSLSSNDRLSRNNDDTKDFKSLFEETRLENERLQSKMEEMKKQMLDLQKRLDLADDSNMRSQLETEKRERRTLERKLSDFEKKKNELLADNQRLKDENSALIRVISKLSK